MSFINEYVPKAHNETSVFLRAARGPLRVDLPQYNKWTVDRERSMALVKTGAARPDGDGQPLEFWLFIDEKGTYKFNTTLTRSEELSTSEIAIERVIGFSGPFEATLGQISSPDAESLQHIKEALREYKDYGVLSKYKSCVLTLRTGEGKVL